MPPLTRKLAASLFLLALACLCLAASPARRAAARQENAPQENTQTPAKEEPKVSVYGRAVYADTQRPVRRAVVRLRSLAAQPPQASFTGLTDAGGLFRIKGVTPGRYVVYVEGPGLLTPESFRESEGPVVIGENLDQILSSFKEVKVDGSADAQVTVRARLGASVSGKVSYADGDPARGAQVRVLRRAGGRDVQAGGGASVRTDERGRFRVSALAPGEYVVVASELMAHVASSDTQPATPSTLALTYYPSEVKAEKASVVALAEGEEREDIDITVVEREMHSISGIVRARRDGGPVYGARVHFVARGTAEESALEYMAYFAYGPNVVTTDEQGRWRFEEMPDGDYIICVIPPPNISSEDDAEEGTDEEGEPEQPAKAEAAKPRPTPTPKPKGYATARQPVTVADNEVSDLVLTLGDEGKISGNVTAEGGRQLPQNVYVIAHSQQPEGGASFYSNVTNGAFEIESLPPGKYSIYASSYVIPGAEQGDLYVKSVTWRGHDLTRETLELKEGESVEGVSVVFTPGRASVNVHVFDGPEKKPARSVFVTLVSPDAAQHPSDVPFCITDQDGACVASGAPGEYAVVVHRRDERLNINDEKDAERRAATAPRVTLRAGETKEFEVAAPAKN
jgi:5-hydroxyisourate hydrolase-like protein (transthyretin family)